MPGAHATGGHIHQAVVVAVCCLGLSIRQARIVKKKKDRDHRYQNENKKVKGRYKTISVVCCALNEETTIARTIRR